MNSSYDEIKNEEADLSGSVVEEKIIKIDGEIEIRKYYVGYQNSEKLFLGIIIHLNIMNLKVLKIIKFSLQK